VNALSRLLSVLRRPLQPILARRWSYVTLHAIIGLGLAVEAVQFMKVALQEPLPQVWIPSALAAGVATAALFLCTVRIANRSHR
jgi:putative copper export protein